MKYKDLEALVIEEQELDALMTELQPLITEGYVSSALDTLEKLERLAKKGVLNIKKLIGFAPKKEDPASKKIRRMAQYTATAEIEKARQEDVQKRKEEALAHPATETETKKAIEQKPDETTDTKQMPAQKISEKTVNDHVERTTKKLFGEQIFKNMPILGKKLKESPPFLIWKFIENTKGSLADKLALLYIIYMGDIDLESVGTHPGMKKAAIPVVKGTRL